MYSTRSSGRSLLVQAKYTLFSSGRYILVQAKYHCSARAGTYYCRQRDGHAREQCSHRSHWTGKIQVQERGVAYQGVLQPTVRSGRSTIAQAKKRTATKKGRREPHSQRGRNAPDRKKPRTTSLHSNIVRDICRFGGCGGGGEGATATAPSPGERSSRVGHMDSARESAEIHVGVSVRTSPRAASEGGGGRASTRAAAATVVTAEMMKSCVSAEPRSSSSCEGERVRRGVRWRHHDDELRQLRVEIAQQLAAESRRTADELYAVTGATHLLVSDFRSQLLRNLDKKLMQRRTGRFC